MTEATIIKLNATERDADKNPRQLRAAGFIPATIYGKGEQSRNVQVNAHEFEMASRSNLDATFALSIGNETKNVVIQELQKNYSINQVLNIEFKIV